MADVTAESGTDVAVVRNAAPGMHAVLVHLLPVVPIVLAVYERGP